MATDPTPPAAPPAAPHPPAADSSLPAWASASLRAELNPALLPALRAQALAAAPDLDAESPDQALLPYLSAYDGRRLLTLRRYQALRQQGLADTLYHTVPRARLQRFYEQLTPAQQTFVAGLFVRRHGEGGYTGPSDEDALTALCSLRANLTPGPAAPRRSDRAQPAGTPAADPTFDPSFDPGGEPDELSRKLLAAQQAIDRLTAPGPTAEQRAALVEEIVNYLLDAELTHAARQGTDSFWETTLRTDVAGLWQQDAPATAPPTWHKRHRPA